MEDTVNMKRLKKERSIRRKEVTGAVKYKNC
jgi:hypothetical protein